MCHHTSIRISSSDAQYKIHVCRRRPVTSAVLGLSSLQLPSIIHSSPASSQVTRHVTCVLTCPSDPSGRVSLRATRYCATAAGRPPASSPRAGPETPFMSRACATLAGGRCPANLAVTEPLAELVLLLAVLSAIMWRFADRLSAPSGPRRCREEALPMRVLRCLPLGG